jgi:WD40 repeat protein/tRNA A-37 threonylcarbamoyl transferase component Bud32
MSQTLQQKVDEAFAAALAAQGDSSNGIDLGQICGGDERVAREVRSLLEHLDLAGAHEGETKPFLNPVELHGSRGLGLHEDALLREWGGEAIGQRVDGFTIIGKLGEGGMGIVYVAEQHNPRRTVALKVMRRSLATTSTLRRFEREAQLLGQLNHPGIAQIYAAGIADISGADGVPVRAPYIAMELVTGATILDFVGQSNCDQKLKLELIAQVCDAIQHAHQRGVIHRDLKPANILVDSHSSPVDFDELPSGLSLRVEDSRVVKVLDFGVARPIDDKLDEQAAQLTAHGHLVGTLAYMAPEQLSHSNDLDTRCDVYAIGVILYQLLTGKYPIDVSGCGIAEAARRIAEHNPNALGADFSADLQTIVAKSLQKDVSRRYQSAGELARDIRLYLAGEPIEARRDSLLYVMRRQAGRYRRMLIAAALVLVTMLVLLFYAHVQAQRQAIARADADRAAARLAEELEASRIEQARLLGQTGDIASAERFLWDSYLAHPDSREARWALWEMYSHTACLRTTTAHASNTLALAVDPSADRFATGGDDGFVRFWSLPDGKLLQEIKTKLGELRSLALAPDGSWLVAAGANGAAVIDKPTGNSQVTLRVDSNVLINCVAISPDARLIATACSDGVIRLWRAGTLKQGTLLCEINPDKPSNSHKVAFDSSGSRLVAGYDDGSVRIFELSTQQDSVVAQNGPTLSGHPSAGIGSVSFSPDGRLVVCGTGDRTIHIWNSKTGELVGSFDTHNGTARSCAFSPDGTKLAVIGYFHVQIYDVATRQLWMPANVSALGSDGGADAAFSRDGRYLISGGGYGALHIWELADDPAARMLDPGTKSSLRGITVGAARDDVAIASAHTDGTINIYRRHDDWRCVRFKTAPAQSIALTGDLSQIIVGAQDGRVLIFGADGKQRQEFSAHAARVNEVRVSTDGKLLISCGADGAIRAWKLRDGQWQPGALQQRQTEVLGLALNADANRIVSTERRSGIGLWSLPDLQPLAMLDAQSPVWKLSLSHDGRWLAVGMWDRSVQLWSRTSGDPSSGWHRQAKLIGHTQLISGQSFHTADSLLASSAADGLVKIWDVPSTTPRGGDGADVSRRCLATLVAHAGEAMAVEFLPRPLEHQLVAGYRDGSVRIWDLQHFDRHIAGQIEYQQALRRNPH